MMYSPDWTKYSYAVCISFIWGLKERYVLHVYVNCVLERHGVLIQKAKWPKAVVSMRMCVARQLTDNMSVYLEDINTVESVLRQWYTLAIGTKL